MTSIRIIIPFTRTLNKAEYEKVIQIIVQLIPEIIIDTCSLTYNQCMFFPVVLKDRKYSYYEGEGEILDPDTLLNNSSNEDWFINNIKEPFIPPESLKREKGDPLSKPGMIGLFNKSYRVSEAIDKYLPHIYRYAKPNRYTFIGAEGDAGLAIYNDDLLAYSFHMNSDPQGGKEHNAYDLVCTHLYGEGKEFEEKFNASLLANDEKVKIQIAKERREQSERPIEKDENTSWMKDLEMDNKGNYLQTPENVLLIFRNDPALKDKFYYDLFINGGYTYKNISWDKSDLEQARPIDRESDEAQARLFFGKKPYQIKNKQVISDSFKNIIREKESHPVREYLNSLTPTEDFSPSDLFCEIFHVDKFSGRLFEIMLLGAVYRVFKPGCKFDTMLILSGPQGIGKSSFIRALGREWFSDSFYTFEGKDAFELLRGKWIVEVQELSPYKKSDITKIKSFLSSQIDYYRGSYKADPIEHHRQCVLIGTTNDREMLRDNSGSRRFHVIELPFIKLADNPALLEFLNNPKLVDQCWAWAVEQYNKRDEGGAKPYLDSEESLQLENRNEIFNIADELIGIIEAALNKKRPDDKSWGEVKSLPERQAWYGKVFDGYNYNTKYDKLVIPNEVCTYDIWYDMLGNRENSVTKRDSYRIIDILNSLGWRKSKKKETTLHYKSQYVYIRPISTEEEKDENITNGLSDSSSKYEDQNFDFHKGSNYFDHDDDSTQDYREREIDNNHEEEDSQMDNNYEIDSNYNGNEDDNLPF